MRGYTRDVALAVRAMFRRPGYALPVIATLAVGIGANTAIFSVFNWILFRPLPGVERPDELVTVRYQRPKSAGNFWVSYSDYADIRNGTSGSLAGLAAALPLKMDVAAGGVTSRRDGEVVTTNYFSLLGVAPILGRDFTASEERPGAADAGAIISHQLWRTVFNSDAGVLGKHLMLNGRHFVVVGVVPAGFQGRSLVTASDFWIPIGTYPSLQPPGRTDLFANRRQTLFGDAFGRLRRGATVAQAQAEATAAAANSPDFMSRSGRPARSSIGPVLAAGVGHEAYAAERLTTIFTLLMGAVALLLLLACANAANLLLARGASRRREIAVCQAIGASRLRIVRQLFLEGVVLSAAAGAAGLVLAVWLTSLFDGMRILMFLPAVTGVGIDWRVCAFAFAAAMLTGVVFAIAPAIVSSRVELHPSLKDGLTSSRHGRRLVRGALVTIQVAVSVVLLVGAGLFIRTLNNIRALDLGMDVDGLVSVGVEPGQYGYSPARSQAYIRDLVERIRSAPGVENAAFTWTTPYSPRRDEMTFLLPQSPGEKFTAASTSVSRDFFRTMRIPLLAGRDFTEAELSAAGEQFDNKPGAVGVVIISRRLADTVFPNGGAVGSRVTLAYPKGKIVEVVGIAGDVRGRPLTQDPEPWSYAPTSAPTWGLIQVRSSLPTAEAIGTIREVARAVDPVVTPHDLESFGASIDRALSEQRLFARLIGLFAAVAGILAGIGIYGMMAGAVTERRREFGIRIALGAKTAVVLRQVMRTAVWLAVVGVICGVGAAAGLRRLIEARLYGVSGLDPTTIAAAACAIVLLSIVATAVPAIRATRIDPAISLRAE